MRSADSLPVLIFDLDGTILRTNSFPLWVVYLTVGRIPELDLRQRVSLSKQTMRLLLSRKIGRLSHDELQRRLQMVWQAAIASGRLPMTNRYEAWLLRRVRPNLGALLSLLVKRQFDLCSPRRRRRTTRSRLHDDLDFSTCWRPGLTEVRGSQPTRVR